MNLWDNLPGHARVWVYGANRRLSDQELTLVKNQLEDFCADWAAHGAKLACGFNILYDQLVILAVDEQQAAASGCSIDSSVRVIREIDANLNIDLFNRLRAFVVRENGLETYSPSEFKTALEANQINADTAVIDPLVLNLDQMNQEFIKPVSDTWLKKYSVMTN